jgi:hypothetical protein
MTTQRRNKMKKLLVISAIVMSVATLGRAANVTDTGPGSAGDVLYYTGPAGNDQGTWSSLPNLVQTIINNNTVVPATIGTSLNSGAVSTVGNVDVTGTGITQTVTGSGASGTSSYDFSNLQTNQSVANASAISGIQNMTDNSLLTQTVNNLGTTSSVNSTAITNIQNLSDNSLLTQTVNGNTAGIAAINNMTDPTTVLNQTVNGNTAAITNETTRATGAETTLQNNITNETNRAEGVETGLQNGLNSETNARIAGDQALQSQINNINAQAQDNTNRIDRLEQTKYLLEPTVRLYDDKHFQVQAFDSYDVRHGMNSALGMRVMFKVGKSYEEKLIAKTNPEIARLLSANVSSDVAERDEIRKQLAEDRALIQKQSDLLAKLSAPSVLNVPVASTSRHVFGTPSKADEDLLKAMDDSNEAALTK